MKAIDSIRNRYMKVPAMTWMWIGCILIGLSTVLSTIAIYHPSNLLSTIAQGLAGFGIIFTIVQAYRSARDFEQERRTRETKDQYIYDRTPEGRTRRNLEQLRTSMHKDSQEPHS